MRKSPVTKRGNADSAVKRVEYPEAWLAQNHCEYCIDWIEDWPRGEGYMWNATPLKICTHACHHPANETRYAASKLKATGASSAPPSQESKEKLCKKCGHNLDLKGYVCDAKTAAICDCICHSQEGKE